DTGLFFCLAQRRLLQRLAFLHVPLRKEPVISIALGGDEEHSRRPRARVDDDGAGLFDHLRHRESPRGTESNYKAQRVRITQTESPTPLRLAFEPDARSGQAESESSPKNNPLTPEETGHQRQQERGE